MFNSYNTFWGSISLHSERPFQASILTVTVLNRLARVFSLSIERVKHMQAFEASEALAQQFLSGLKKEEQQTETTERFVTLGCEHGFGRLSLHFCHANTDTLSVLRQVCGKMAKMLDADLFVISIGPEAQVFSNSLVDEELYLRLAKRLKEKRMQEIYSTLYVLDDPMLSLDASFGQILPGLLYIPLYTYLDAFAVFMRSAESDGQDCKEWSRVDLEMVSFVQKLFSWFLEGRLEQEFASKSVERDKGMMMDISHAIRTPMNAVVNFIEVALTENFSKEITTFLEYAYESSHALLAVLEDILSLTLLANKHSLSLRNKPFRLVSVLRSIFSGYQNHPTIKFVPTFTATCEDLILDGDAPKLSQILINLLNNAFKYTVEGQVDCKISHTIQQDRCQLQIQVSDTGIGIPEKHLSHIFEEFERIETTHPLRGQKEGLGLGLSIVYRLVQLMNGSITVQSKEGHGSHFTLLLNFTIREAALPRSPQLQSRAAGPVTVLVAEDNLVNQRVIVKRIEKLGYVPTVTCNGLECYQKYRSDPNKYDVILMDMMMPVMNGMEATEKIRQFERKHKSKRVPIIAVTASITPQDMETYSNVDLDGCFGKPLDFQKLDEFMCSIRKSPIHKLDSKIAIMHQ
ncbi:hypothetical protein EDD86DRAFT_215386 [Gorgonomyces haynaldii]|nr:hypothetical protein EDD86DRAFT_215386 [Gorgonomyces haynaldii]